MTQTHDNRPIGIFDSGLGGLTVVHAVSHALPNESVVYFGDTARVPYGTKSRETIIRYSIENSDFLMNRDVKAVVVACNSASAHALPALQSHLNVPVFGVIEPGVQLALRTTRNGHIGVIGTAATIASQAYARELKAGRKDVRTISMACPLFVPIVEEGWLADAITEQIVERYLATFRDESIDTLILGCTHYPLLKPIIARVLGEGVTLIDSGEACAINLKSELASRGLLAAKKENADHIYVTDLPDKFEIIARRFLGEKLPVVKQVSL